MEIAVFLRAVNLGLKNKMSMGDLRVILNEAGFGHVRSYLNTGNLIMQNMRSIKEDEEMIKDLIKTRFDIVIDVFAVSVDELKSKIDRDIFGELTADQRAYIVFMHETIKIDLPCHLQHIHVLKTDGTMLFCIGTKSAKHTSFPNALIEKKYKVRCTSRNLNTLEKILEAS
jgi:uncharacterized protein (DUF1697 family)